MRLPLGVSTRKAACPSQVSVVACLSLEDRPSWGRTSGHDNATFCRLSRSRRRARGRAAGRHSLAYYALVAAVPVVALAALHGLGDVLDGTEGAPHDRGIAVLSAIAARSSCSARSAAPLLADGPPPVVGITAVVAALAIFAVQALVAATAVAPREQARTSFRRS